MEVIIGLIIGAALGFLIGWLVSKGRAGKEQSQRQAEIAGLQGQLAQTATAEQLLAQAKEQFSAAAELSAAAALKGNSEEFLKLANENLGRTMEQAKGEFDRRHIQFQELVKPLADNYGKLNPQLEALMQQSQTLAAATGKLSSALTDVRQVGHWGEVQLRKVVEMANMTAYSDFAEQATIGGGEQDRPDLIVRLPEGRTVVIDAKASIAAALEAQGMDDETAANAAWERHAVNLKAQVTNLSRKGYGSKVAGSLDFVVMFVPGDQFLAAALKSDAGLVDYAISQRIALATPATLIAMLWAINSGWQKWEFARNAEEIRQVGSEMHDRLLVFLRHYGAVQNRLAQTVKAFNDSAGSLEGRVLVSARRMAEMRAVDAADLKEPELVEAIPREFQALPEAAAGVDGAVAVEVEDAEPQLAAADN